jgi:hypothetical protein
VQLLTNAMQKWERHYLTLGTVTTNASALIGVNLQGFDKTQKGKPVEIVSVGEVYPGKDVALLKIDGLSNMPTMPVGADTDVVEGATLHVVGYPAASTFGFSADSEVQPSVTNGPITAIKTTPSGMKVFQTQAPASPGNSGGPVVNDQGKVVGILVAGATDGNGTQIQGQEYVVPISVVTEKLNQSNVKPSPSQTTTIYNKALEEYYQEHYKAALADFNQVTNLYPGHPYAPGFITKSQSAITAGKDKTPPGLSLALIAGAGGVGLLVVIVVGLVLLTNRRRRPDDPATAILTQGPDLPTNQPYPTQGLPFVPFGPPLQSRPIWQAPPPAAHPGEDALPPPLLWEPPETPQPPPRNG